MSITTGSGYWGTLEAVNVKVPVRMHRAVGGFSQSQASGGCRGTFGLFGGLLVATPQHPPSFPGCFSQTQAVGGCWGNFGVS